MRFLLISDMHGNLEALSKALEFIEPEKIDKVICLGDIVGYMTNPNECVSLVKNYDCIMGNHDYAIFNDEELALFNEYAYKALLWTKEHLNENSKTFLKSLPLTRKYEMFTICHGSIINPQRFDYIEFDSQIKENLQAVDTSLLFVGHSHVPVIAEMSKKYLPYGNYSFWHLKKSVPEWNTEFVLHKECRYLINIGSVGQPRDGISKGCCVIFDSEKYTLKFLRFEYDMDKTIQKMIECNMPEILFKRLTVGR